MKASAICLVVLAASLAGCFERVGAQVYVRNGTGQAEHVHVVVVGPDGQAVLDEAAVIEAATSYADSTLLGTIRGPEGTYHWSVDFGNRTASMEERLEDHVVTMNVELLPDRLDVGFSLA